MGVIKQGILGGFSGKVAGVVGSAWKGIAYMKALPLSVANPQTAGQVAQRTKFSNVSQFASSILTSLIKPLWDRFAQRQSGYNAFVQANIDLFAAETPNPPADLILSAGKMASTAIDTLVPSEGGPEATITWVDDSGEGFKLATDKAYAIAINRDQGIWAVSSGTAVRSDGTLLINMPENWGAAENCDAYLSFLRSDGTIVSDTAYKTAVSV